MIFQRKIFILMSSPYYKGNNVLRNRRCREVGYDAERSNNTRDRVTSYCNNTDTK